jgi:hypothetical protein
MTNDDWSRARDAAAEEICDSVAVEPGYSWDDRAAFKAGADWASAQAQGEISVMSDAVNAALKTATIYREQALVLARALEQYVDEKWPNVAGEALREFAEFEKGQRGE